jgi:general secretion pathway protein F
MVAGAVWTTRNSAAQRLLYQWLARLPLIGDWILESETGRWATTLSTLLTNRVDLVRGLELAREGLQLAFLRARLTEVLRAVRGGSTLADALSDHGAITGTGIDLVRVGERSGALPEMLSSLGELYDVTSRDRMKRVLQMIEPLAILIIGTSIGIIITGVILAVMGGQEAGF